MVSRGRFNGIRFIIAPVHYWDSLLTVTLVILEVFGSQTYLRISPTNVLLRISFVVRKQAYISLRAVDDTILLPKYFFGGI